MWLCGPCQAVSILCVLDILADSQSIVGLRTDEQFRSVTVEECETLCCARSWCKSFDYNLGDNHCNLADVDASHQFSQTTSSGSCECYNGMLFAVFPCVHAVQIAVLVVLLHIILVLFVLIVLVLLAVLIAVLVVALPLQFVLVLLIFLLKTKLMPAGDLYERAPMSTATPAALGPSGCAALLASIADRVNAECCGSHGDECGDGAPRTCSEECATVWMPFVTQCSSWLTDSMPTSHLNAVSRKCATTEFGKYKPGRARSR